MKLNSVYSDGALLLCCAVTDVRGTAEPGKTVRAELKQGRRTVRFAEAVCGSDGHFSVPIQGEPASFDEYSLEVTCGDERVTVSNILFGELWLTAGQSNMAMPNWTMENREEFLDTAAKHCIRFYKFTTACDSFENPPFTEAYDTPGKWSGSYDREGAKNASAAACAACLVLAERFESEGCPIPVGFVDTSIGATSIEAWLPLSVTDGEMKEYLIKTGHYTYPDKRAGDCRDHYDHNSVFFNSVIAPLGGLKTRGMLWYQGEGNTGADPVFRECYKQAVFCLHREYRARFGEPDGKFPLICSLLYPWIYGDDGMVRMGYVNEGISDAAAENREISAVPIHDLPAKWSYYYDYNPIHPTNKYGCGERLGEVMLAVSYGGDGMSSAAHIRKCVRKKGALELHFSTCGEKLYHTGDRLNGFFIAAKNGVYVPADAVIISRTAVRVSAEHIPTPSAVCYQMSDLQNDGNLFCGNLPVAPFATERDKPVFAPIKPWLFAGCDSQFTLIEGGPNANAFCYPVRFPLPGTSLCHDPAYRAVRLLSADAKSCGFYVKAQKAMPLDLHRYSAMKFDIYARPEIGVTVKLTLNSGDAVKEKLIKADLSDAGEGTGIICCTVPLHLKAADTVTKAEFLFDIENQAYPTVAIGDIALVPKRGRLL